jgi:hypothetical protein
MWCLPNTTPISKFSTENLVPYFQLPTRNPPLGFNNYGGGIPTRSSGSPPHGSGRPPGGGNKPLKGSCGPPGKGGPPSGGEPPSGGGPLRGGGCGFLVGGINVAFGAPCLGSLWNPLYPMCITTKCGCNSLVPIQ